MYMDSGIYTKIGLLFKPAILNLLESKRSTELDKTCSWINKARTVLQSRNTG